MRQVVIYAASSADGYLAQADGSVDFLEGYGFADASQFMESVQAVITGRKTFDQALQFGEWMYGENSVVVTHRALENPPPGVRVASGDLKPIVEDLRQGEGVIWALGGADLYRQLLEQDLVDQIRITYVPRLLGTGIPLFPSGTYSQRLRLMSTESWETGLVQLRWGVVRHASNVQDAAGS